MALSDIVNVIISNATQAVTQAGFGVPLILGYHTRFSDRLRFYSNAAALVTDGFLTTDPEYMAAAAIFSQNPAPTRIAVGRRLLAPTMVVELTPTAKNSRTYTVKVNGTAFNYASDASATVQEIVEGLKAAYDGAAIAGITASEDNTKLVFTGSAGTWFHVEVSDNDGNANGMGLWSKIQETTADAGIATDLADMLLASSEWYGLILTHRGEAEVEAAAAWVESNKKLLIAASQDTDIKGGSSTDLASDIETSAYARTAILYHHRPKQFADAAWMGKLFPFDPGSETWKFKTLAGVDASVLTETEITNVKNKHANWYQALGGVNLTQEGWSGAGEFLDVTRFSDWLRARLQERIYSLLVNSRKVPFTDAGVAAVEAVVKAQLEDGIIAGGLAADPAPTVTVPKVSAISANDKAARLLPNVNFTAKLAGAIHSLTINGQVSV